MTPVQRRRLVTIFLVVMVDMIGASVILPLLAFYARTYRASDATVGLLFAAFPLAQLAGAPLLGRLSDRFGRRPILLVSILGSAAGYVMLGLAGSLAVLFAARVVDGLTGGNIAVAHAYISDVSDERSRGKALGMIGAAFGLGFMLGPPLGGLLSHWGYPVPSFTAAGLCVANLVLVAALLPESITTEGRVAALARSSAPLDARALVAALCHPRVGPLLGVRIVTGTSFAMLEGGFALWAPNVLGVGPRVNGLVLGYLGVCVIIVQGFAIGRLTRRFTDAQLLVTAVTISALAFGGWAVADRLWVLLVLLPVMAFGMGVTNTMLSSSLSKAVYPEELGGIFGINTGILSVTRIPGPVLTGWLLGALGGWAPGVLASMLTAPLAPFAYRRFIARPAPPLPPREETPAATPPRAEDAAG